MTAGLCAALLSAMSFGQAPSQPPAQAPGNSSSGAPTKAQPQAKQEPPVVHVITRLVQVNAIVQDKKGEPVTDLTRDDFTVLDQGQSQTISTFSVESLRMLPAPAQPAPTNVFSNRFEQKADTPTSVTVILLDGLNTRFEDMAQARAQIIKFLGQLQPQDRVALYTLTTRLRVLHDFTTDATSLLRALERSKGHVSAELAASEPEPVNLTGIDALDEFLTAANQRVADFYTINRVEMTAGAIEGIANHLAGLPGRKNLVWVSGSFPFSIGLDAPFTPATASQERRTFSEEVERAARALNNANMAIYPVDARGLIGPSFATRGPAFNPSVRRRPNVQGPSNIKFSPDRANFDTMNILADRTGGRAFYNTNDIQGSIRRAIEDSRVTYVLGFYPTHGNWDGKFREIKVQVMRPGLHVRYRRGYFALADVSLDSKQREVVMHAALGSPLDDTSLGLEVHVQVVDVPGAMTLKTELLVYPRDLTLVAQGDRWVGAVDVLFVQRGPDGKDLAGEVKTLNLNLKRETYDEVMKKGLSLTRNLPLASGVAQFRVVVRDATSGSIGSLTIPLTKLLPPSGSS